MGKVHDFLGNLHVKIDQTKAQGKLQLCELKLIAHIHVLRKLNESTVSLLKEELFSIEKEAKNQKEI
jgi:hypothetical protein